MAKKKPQGLMVVRTELSALTRQQWAGLVIVDKTVTENDLDDLTDLVYGHVDGGDYQDDTEFWEKGEACQSTFVTDVNEIISEKPTLVAYKDDEDSLVLAALPRGEAAAVYLRKLRAAGGDAERIGRVEKARELFETIEDLNGYGIAGTDDNALAEAIAERFNVRPVEVFDAYVSAGDEYPDEYAGPGVTFPWPDPEDYAGWPRFEVVLKGFDRIHNADNDEEFPTEVISAHPALVNWAIAPSHAVASKWVVDNGLTEFVEELLELSGRDDIQDFADGLDLVLDSDGRIIGGDPDTPAAWRKKAMAFGDLLAAHNIVPVYTNHYRCDDCDEEWEDTAAGQPDDECPTCEKKYTPHKSDEVHGFVETYKQ